jgi:flagellar hook protein FlgE
MSARGPGKAGKAQNCLSFGRQPGDNTKRGNRMSALQTGVSGMLAHQTRMDAIGNNITNSNTVGFKSSRMLFADALYAAGGTDTEIGQGVLIAAADTNYGQGSMAATGRTLDVAIEGEGFLTVTDGSNFYHTRNGSLALDAEGSLVHLASGMKVVALPPAAGPADAASVTPASSMKVPLGQTSVARVTSQMNVGGNLDSRSAAGGATQLTARVFDSLGAGHELTLTFTHSATPGQWDVTASSPDGTVTVPAPAQVAFDADGRPTTDTVALEFTLANPGGATATLPVNVSVANVTQLAQENSTSLRSQDGLPPGVLTGVTIQPDGAVMGVYSNGLTDRLGQLVTSTFANTGGLQRYRDSLYQATPDSGLANYGIPSATGHGALRNGQLESSNVNLAQEFADMILTQRGFQASSRVVSVADEMLQVLMNTAQ